MTESEILDELTGVMREVFDDDDLEVRPDMTAGDVAGWDSQAHVMLIVATEQRFGIRFRTAEFESLRNVGEFVTLIAAKLPSRA